MESHPNYFDDPHSSFQLRGPEFLVISPPKTGSTWLAANLRHHPQLFIPEIKEIRYFNSLFKWLDYRWYCSHFREAGNRKAGEASPSYASLPLDSIRRLSRLLPGVKLVYLMRDPVSRAWSHARHNRKYREANFGTAGPNSEGVINSDDQWCENFSHDWPLASGDYLGHLRRWLSVFPKSQFYVGFYESIAAQPAELLGDIFRFLDVDPAVDLSRFPLREQFLPGEKTSLTPQLASALRDRLRNRTQELVGLLRERLQLTPPAEWANTLGESSCSETPGAAIAERLEQAQFPTQVMAMEESFQSAFRFIEEYRGYNIVICRGGLYSLAKSLDRHAILSLDAESVRRLQDEEICITGRTLADVKERITDHILSATHARIETLQDQLQRAQRSISAASQQAQEVIGRVAADLAALSAAFHRPTRARRLIRALRRVLRRLVSLLRLPGVVAGRVQ